MAISEQMRAARDEMLVLLADGTATALEWKLRPEVALQCRMAVAELLRDAWRAFRRAETDDECLAAMRTSATMLRLIADDMDDAAIERAKIRTPFPWSKSKS
jgi:hypothetical protein